MQEMVIVDRHGNRHGGRRRFATSRGGCGGCGGRRRFLHFPGSMFLWRPLYRWVARNRYRLSGGAACDEGTCSLHR